MSEYSPLGQYLEKQSLQGNKQVSLSFQEIERIINRELPPTARNNKNWWANIRLILKRKLLLLLMRIR